ncbi:putative TetR family transcriptional regulator [Gordonia effusa NBRC 100432]|uniref:Putative TetR family transcriptional regulator n=1 Tax=Gordonia effusa NBRC 100432 TaxID=1077974 RepID=H0QV54_9ACTN|nr:TetR/AcrR family transcriptional regulator [Gordonia effusa]GAB16705.1 putative TetR family transcriptional regulator [Gordonia effusa NBRC 100432]
MRTHGWGGDVPINDDEAVARILAATRACIDRNGKSTSLADVARELQVTRPTVYRYFKGTEELLQATAMDAVGDLLGRVSVKLAGITEPDVAVVDGLLVVLDELTAESYVGLVLDVDHLNMSRLGELTSDVAYGFARSVVMQMDVDWAARGFADQDVDDVIEILLRALQSLIVDRARERPAEDLRRFLDRWVGAAIREIGT